jgi:hypothetical protein
MRLALIAALAFLFAGCAGHPERGAGAGKGASAWHGGRLEPLRDYLELYKENGQDRRRKVEEFWDYSRGLVVRRFRDLEGRLLAEELDEDFAPSASEREREAAFALVRADPRLASSAVPAEAEWFGGFAYRDLRDPHCAARSRCVHVMVTLDRGLRKIIHAIVDLQRGRVVHPFYDRPTSRPLDPSEPDPEKDR